MESKIFEVRDSLTYIPVLAVLLEGATEAEEYHLGRAGFRAGVFVLVYHLLGNQAQWDPSRWAASGSRTLKVAHEHIGSNWNDLKSGEVIDVEFLLGESIAPKRSEANAHPD